MRSADTCIVTTLEVIHVYFFKEAGKWKNGF